MQYNFHNEKYKISDVGGIHREQFREYTNPEQYKNEVDSARTEKNSYIELTENGRDWFAHIREAKESTSEITGRAVRKDAVVLCSTVESVPSTWDDETCKNYFSEKAKWYEDYLHEKAGVDKNCMLSVCVHLDETTPHATYVWIPEKDGKLQAKNILDRNFLKGLQTDSQQFTFEWIQQYEEKQGITLEKLEPIESGSQKQHLSEAEYKKEQIRLQVEELKKEEVETKQRIGNLADEKAELSQAKEHYEKQAARLTEKVEAPDLQKYEEVVAENQDLKKELSWKDRVIEKLQEEKVVLQATVNRLSDRVQELSDKVSEIAHKAGQRLMHAFGYDMQHDPTVQEYPTSDVSSAMATMKEEVQQYNSDSLRVIPDHDHPGSYMVASRKSSGEYETVKTDFSSREEAEDFRRNYGHAAENLGEKLNEMSDDLKIK